jgi:hypothetical protein
VFPVRYGLNFYINLLRNSVFKGLKESRYFQHFLLSYIIHVSTVRITNLFGDSVSIEGR